ncbi:MAG TPA: hypothetical protein VF257_11385 [Solirubrobacteraceae bacterium]
MELGNVTLTIPRQQCGTLLSSARGLIRVKLDAIEHAEGATKEASADAPDPGLHRAELDEVERLAEALERLGRDGDDQQLTVRRALIDEIVVSALSAEAQELADRILTLSGREGDLGQITTRLAVVDGLVATLMTVRS